MDEAQLRDIYLMLESSEENLHLIVHHDSLAELWQSWCSCFEIIEAAGGVVVNDSGDILLIHRLGKWDLPKGKIESGEDKESAAVREVMEECSVPAPRILKELSPTYHTYRLKNQPVLKFTWWYEMALAGIPDLTPQTEEDITEVIWCSRSDLPEKLQNTYANIAGILRQYLS